MTQRQFFVIHEQSWLTCFPQIVIGTKRKYIRIISNTVRNFNFNVHKIIKNRIEKNSFMKDICILYII